MAENCSPARKDWMMELQWSSPKVMPRTNSRTDSTAYIYVNRDKVLIGWLVELVANVTYNNTSVKSATARSCAGGRKKRLTYGLAPNAIDIM